MEKRYNPAKIEPKWQVFWEKEGLHKAPDFPQKKFYCLDMFPYPSGDGLHVGHLRGYTLSDVYARYKKMQGYDVLHPMGFDAFGLPAENAAIKKGIHPAINTEKNIANIKRQIKMLGAIYDWNREVITSQPDYYKWTQWIFLQLFKKGLAYKKKSLVNWCPKCKTVLANEQVVSSLCERCDSEVEKKELEQWFFKITDYAQRLLDDLEKIDWPERVKVLQRNWIGRSEGALLKFSLKNLPFKVEVFTTRPDTVFGATYLVLAPEHELVVQLKEHIKNWPDVEKYIKRSQRISEIERTKEEREKTGIILEGILAINPVNGQEIPVFIADYVLKDYGTGAIMAVPAHDERDFDFAAKFGLKIIEVISKNGKSSSSLKKAYTQPGILVNSGQFSGMNSELAKKTIVDWGKKQGWAEEKTWYRLRDWLISRQRYWGAPIPIIYCEKCGIVPVPENELPVLLPPLKDFTPKGKPPLATVEEFVNTVCPQCGGKAQREVDTMDTFVCSSWYYLRYPDSKNDEEPFSQEKIKAWLPVDLYVGGIEHATMHLLYARFITKVLYDLGWLHFDEPFTRLYNIGMIYYKGSKMSKSRGNVVNPDDMVAMYGIDTVRLYELFMGPPNQDCEWSDKGIAGCFRFLKRAYNLFTETYKEENQDKELEQELERKTHILIKEITDDIENLNLNTAVSSFMEFLNFLNKVKGKVNKKIWDETLIIFLRLLAPFVPHFAEEIYRESGGKRISIFKETWPQYSEDLIKMDFVPLLIQVNGKMKGKIDVRVDLKEKEAQTLALNYLKEKISFADENIKKAIFKAEKTKKIINFVISF